MDKANFGVARSMTEIDDANKIIDEMKQKNQVELKLLREARELAKYFSDKNIEPYRALEIMGCLIQNMGESEIEMPKVK